MTANTILLALGAGLVAAVVFASATTGAMPVRFALFFLAPLSLYLAGLGLGPAYSAIAGVVAILAVAAIINPAAALFFSVSEALPAAALTRQALLARGDDTAREWFPVGRLVSSAALFGGGSALLVLILMGGDVSQLAKAMEAFVEDFVKNKLPDLPGAPLIPADQIPEIANVTLRLLPSVLAVLVMATIIVNLWLAGRITLASGRLARPWPDLASLKLSSVATFGLAATLALSFAGGLVGLAAGGFAGGFYFAFVLMGLAVAHFVTRGSPWRGFTLSALYGALFVFSAGTTLILALIGLGETLFGYRAAISRGPPPGHS